MHDCKVHVVHQVVRRQRAAFALELNIGLQGLFSQYKDKTDRLVQIAIGKHRIWLLESCGINPTNISEWRPLFLLCKRLVLADNLLEQASLRKLRKWFKTPLADNSLEQASLCKLCTW
jgi:hypothetical protein